MQGTAADSLTPLLISAGKNALLLYCTACRLYYRQKNFVFLTANQRQQNQQMASDRSRCPWPRRYRGRRGERRRVAQPAGRRPEAPPPHENRPAAAARGGRRECPPHQLSVPLSRGHARQRPGAPRPPLRRRRRLPRARAPPVVALRLRSPRLRLRRGAMTMSPRPRRPGPWARGARHRPGGPRQTTAPHADVRPPPLAPGRRCRARTRTHHGCCGCLPAGAKA